MKLLAVLFSVMVLSSFSAAYAQESEPMILEQVSPSGEILVKLEWPQVYPDEIYEFKVSFHDPKTGKLLDDEYTMAYGVTILQHDHIVEEYDKEGTRNGIGIHEVMFPEESQGDAQVIVYLKAASDHGHTIKFFEEVVFSVSVVPEFGVIAAMVFAVSLVPILLLSKTKLSMIR